MITGTYNLLADPSWSLLQLNEVRLECDTTTGPVTINLPAISTLAQSTNLKLIVVDATANASVNNITINSGGSDTFDDSTANQVILDTDGSSVIFQNLTSTQWVATESIGGGGSGTGEYKFATLPTTSTVYNTLAAPDLAGKAIDLPYLLNAYPFVTLNNGNLGEIQYIQAVLLDDTYIYEVYDLQTVDPENGYWVAYRENPLVKGQLVKVAELKMTTQFWNNWYNYTLKDSGDNKVKFVAYGKLNADTDLVEGFITELTYSNGVLSAVDSNPKFGGVDMLTFYNNLTGFGTVTGKWATWTPEYILDDDYYGMGIGDNYGWTYFRDTLNGIPSEAWTIVGFNVFTGQTKVIDLLTIATTNITNFDWASWGPAPEKAFGNVYSHPSGFVVCLVDSNPVDNGDNVNGVSALWSPDWANDTQVIYLNSRNISNGQFTFTGNSPIGFLENVWYWDSNNFYTFNANSLYNQQCFIATRFNIATREISYWAIPVTETNVNSGLNTFANNNSLMCYINTIPNNFSFDDYYIFSNNEPLKLQSNNADYPTNMLGSKSYSTTTQLYRNIYTLGLEVDEYKGVTF